MADPITKAIDKLRESNEFEIDAVYQEQVKTGKQVDKTNKILSDLVKQFAGNKLDEEEARRDAQRKKGAAGSGGSGSAAGAAGAASGGGLGALFLRGIGGVGAAALGLAAGLGAAVATAVASVKSNAKVSVDKFLKGDTVKNIKTLFDPIKNGVKQFKADFIKGWKTVDFKPMVDFKGINESIKLKASNFKADFAKGWKTVDFKPMVDFKKVNADIAERSNKIVKFFTGIGNSLKQFGTSVNAMQKSISGLSLSDTAVKAMNSVKDTFAKGMNTISKGIQTAKTALKPLTDFFGKVFGVFKTLGKFIALPLTIITSIFEGFKGWQAGFEEQQGMVDKVLGGGIGAIMGVLKNLIAMPLDLLKSGISWIAGKLGFENFEKMLDGFSFEKLFDDIRVKLTEGVIGALNRIKKVFTDMWENITAPFDKGVDISSILEFVIKIPANIAGALLDLVKANVSSLLNIFGQEDMSAKLDSFSFSDTFTDMIDWILALPKKMIDGIMEIFTSNDPVGMVFQKLSNIGEYIMEGLKTILRGVLPDPDSMVGAFVPSAIYDWVGEAPPEPPEATSEVKAINRGEESATPTPVPLTKIQRKKMQFSERIVDNLERRRLERDLTEDEERKLKMHKERFRKLEAKEKKFFADLRASRSSQMQSGEDVQRMSKENAQVQSTPPIVVAPSSNTSNNTSVTNNSAIVDTNLPTRDFSDRQWDDVSP